MSIASKTKEQKIREKLVVWVAFNSKIEDFRTRAFAEHLCMNLDTEAGKATYTNREFAADFNIAPASAHKYMRALIASGEWTVNPLAGRPTAYFPNFLPEILEEIEAEEATSK
jgi:hypothetical protein